MTRLDFDFMIPACHLYNGLDMRQRQRETKTPRACRNGRFDIPTEGPPDRGMYMAIRGAYNSAITYNHFFHLPSFGYV